ncbi:MAG: response regulator transcription factor [Rhodothermales bacterium]|nr:response regulator transcription factor [Rhodothermales bacterium]
MKQFRVSTLVVYDGPGNELLVHLCHPECETSEGCSATVETNDISTNHQRGALTDREKEVLMLLSRGKSTREMAEEMCISQATVRNHTQHVMSKLNVHNRMAAVSLGQKLGLI